MTPCTFRLRPTSLAPSHPSPGRRALLMAAVSSAVVLLAACSGTSAAGSATTATTGAGSAQVSASAPATAGTTASPLTSPSADAAAPTVQSAVKELVAGFPSTVLPLMTGATIEASSIEHGSPVSAVTMTASVTSSAENVLANYTKVFTAQGFKAQPGDAVDGVPTKTFVRAEGQEVVTVSIVETGSTATFTIGATLLPASFK